MDSKRYQVFVSSTFSDLLEERQEVMQALLELDCIPAGMELFPAANESQWSLIERVIDDCDYYIVIIGGRYGSIAEDGQGYTEKEYDYALHKGKPVLAFLHKDPGKIPSEKTETKDEGKEKLRNFRSKVEKRLCKFWDSPKDLGSVVSRGLIQLIKSSPAVGWIKADQVTSEETAKEIIKLKKENEGLREKIIESRQSAPPGTEKFAQGEDVYGIDLKLKTRLKNSYETKELTYTIPLSWNEIFSSMAPLMVDEATEGRLRHALEDWIEKSYKDEIVSDEKLINQELQRLSIQPSDFQIVKIQLRALGLITKSTKSRSVKDTDTYWTLTPFGDQTMTTLMAIKRVP